MAGGEGERRGYFPKKILNILKVFIYLQFNFHVRFPVSNAHILRHDRLKIYSELSGWGGGRGLLLCPTPPISILSVRVHMKLKTIRNLLNLIYR